MPEKEVLAILGKPDDVRTEYDPGGIRTTRTKEIWCYGTNGHLTFPTLGRVYIDQNAKTQYIFGGRGKPPEAGTFKEEQLRELLRLIDRAPELQGHRFDPLPIIQIVDALQPLGKEMALAAIREYLRVASEHHSDAREGLFVVLRVLFEIPADTGYMPRVGLGAPWPPEPKADPKAAPRFPVVLVEDVPVLLVSGYELSGVEQPVEEHVDYFNKHGQLRVKPLHPTHKPLAAYDRFVDSYLRLYCEDARSRQNGKLMVINQLLRLVDSVYRRDADWYGYRFHPARIWTNGGSNWSRNSISAKSGGTRERTSTPMLMAQPCPLAPKSSTGAQSGSWTSSKVRET
jgi:hypothetical protein